MATRGPLFGSRSHRLFSAAIVAMCLAVGASVARGQNNNNNNSGGVAYPYTANVVGGVSINAEGLLSNASTDVLGTLAKQRMESLEKVPGDLASTAAMRKVSLRRLEEAIAECAKDKKPLPDVVRYLAGLQHVEYVFVYPEQRDIVLAGPGEGWKVNEQGALVGITTNRPVMLLDDLMVALRTAIDAAQGGISCSIDPTPEGLARLKDYLSAQQTYSAAIAENVEKALGQQNIRVAGVLGTSHFAQVLVAADYRMKRLAMDFDRSPVRGLPSYLQLVPSSSRTVQTPRFWLEPRYDALLRDPDGLAWNLRGSSVKAMTEEDFLAASGNLTHSGKASAAAQKWCDAMTRKYGELAAADSIFGELQNCMELAVVGAIVVKERLTERSGNSLPALFDTRDVKVQEYNVPKQVASQASVVKRGHNWLVSVSGGVAINSWILADQAKTTSDVAPAREKAAPTQIANWWWD